MEVCSVLYSEESQRNYAALISDAMNPTAGEAHPLRLCGDDGMAVIQFCDDRVEGAEGSITINNAISNLMIFDEIEHPEDLEFAINEAIVLATALEKAAMRLRAKISENE